VRSPGRLRAGAQPSPRPPRTAGGRSRARRKWLQATTPAVARRTLCLTRRAPTRAWRRDARPLVRPRAVPPGGPRLLAPRRGHGKVHAARGMDETCPVSTGGWTRRVQSVREGGGGGRGAARRAAWARTSALVVQSCAYCRRVENLLAPPPGSVSQNSQTPGAWRGGLVARGGGGWYRPWSQTPSGKTFVRETVGGRRSQTPASAPDTCGPRVVQI
jgi:hypothetical protein